MRHPVVPCSTRPHKYARQAVIRFAMAQPTDPVSPGDMTPSSGAQQQLNFEPFQEVGVLRT